jgi:hypothetical protein
MLLFPARVQKLSGVENPSPRACVERFARRCLPTIQSPPREPRRAGVVIQIGPAKVAPSPGATDMPFTRKSVGANVIACLRVSESEPFTHDLELRIALPHQLVTRRWILGASQVSSDPRDEAHHVAQG